MAFSRDSRLRNSSLITTTCKKGASWKTPFFRMKYLPAKRGDTKICIITPKTLDKRAVYRNSMRRKLSAAMEEGVKTNEYLKKKFLIVLFPTPEILSVDHTKLMETIVFSLQKISSRPLPSHHAKRNNQQRRTSRNGNNTQKKS